jgi:uncharacterized protein (TIGR02145 family)
MAENLKTTKYNDNTTIPLVTDNTAWAALITPGYCWLFDMETTYKDIYGAYYNWYSVDEASNDGKNVCPAGWHVPTDAEWTTLITYLGGENVAGNKLKEAGTAHWESPNSDATNETNFTALPGMYRYDFGEWESPGRIGFWWTSTLTSSENAVYIRIEEQIISDEFTKKVGLPVRCLQD